MGVPGLSDRVGRRSELGGVITSGWNGNRIVLDVLVMAASRGLPTMPQPPHTARPLAPTLDLPTGTYVGVVGSSATVGSGCPR